MEKIVGAAKRSNPPVDIFLSKAFVIFSPKKVFLSLSGLKNLNQVFKNRGAFSFVKKSGNQRGVLLQ